jgi:PPOX class probable F420-dependent enzyme
VILLALAWAPSGYAQLIGHCRPWAGISEVVPKPPLPPDLDDFLSQPNPSVIATLESDGTPHTVASWYLWENGRVLVNMDEGRKRLEHLRVDRRVSITVLGNDDWSRHVTLRGRVVSLDPDPAFDAIDRLSRHYTGQPFSRHDRGRVSAWIEVESWHAWAGAQPWTGSNSPQSPAPP